MLQRSGFYANHVFLTVHDAVLAAVEQDLEAFNEIVIDVLVNEIVLPFDIISSASRTSLANRKISVISLGMLFHFCILSISGFLIYYNIKIFRHVAIYDIR